MNLTALRVSFAFLWAIIGLALVFRERLLPELTPKEPAQTNWTLAGYLALAFAGWNLFRAFVGNGRRAPRSRPVGGAKPLARRDGPAADRPHEYNPELDFTKPDPAAEKKAE